MIWAERELRWWCMGRLNFRGSCQKVKSLPRNPECRNLSSEDKVYKLWIYGWCSCSELFITAKQGPTLRVKLWDATIPQNAPKPLKTILSCNWHVRKITKLLTEVFCVGRDERWFYFFFFLWPCHATFRILDAQPGIDPHPPKSLPLWQWKLGLNHRITGEVSRWF